MSCICFVLNTQLRRTKKKLITKLLLFYFAILSASNLFHSDALAKHYRSDTFDDTKLHIINIGKGQSIILAHGCSISLIDAGGEMSKIDHYLAHLDVLIKKRSPKSLNTVIISHSHGDHLRYVNTIIKIGLDTKFLIGNSTLLKKRQSLRNLLAKDRKSVV